MGTVKHTTATTMPGTDRLEVNVSGNIRALMARDRITQGQMAPILGIGQSDLSRKLNNRRPWSLGDVRRAAEHFDVAPERLLDDPGDLLRSRCSSEIPTGADDLLAAAA